MQRQRATPQQIAEQHLGIISKLAWRYWRCLPPSVMASQDPEDFIQSAVVQVMQAATRYDQRRAMSSTFVWTVVNNYGKTILQYHQAKKRQAMMLPEDTLLNCGQPDSGVQFREARLGLEDTLRVASPPTRRKLATFLETRKAPRRWDPGFIEEMRSLLRSRRVGPQDLRVLLCTL